MAEAGSDNEVHLKRVVGLPAAILLVAGTMIGSGAFKKIVPMAQVLHSEKYILIAWIAAGVISLFGAFTYAGLSKMTTETGGVYEYLRLIYGDFVSFLFGWSVFTIVGSGAVAALAFVFAESLSTLLAISGNPLSSAGIKIIAVSAIALLTWLNSRGIKKGSMLNNIVTSAKILGILLLIIGAIFYAGHHAAVIAPVPEAKLQPLHGIALLSAMFGAMLSALWAYDGWANITFVTGELKNPIRNVPIAAMAGVGIATALYVLLNYSYTLVLPVTTLAALSPDHIAATEVAGTMMGGAGTVLIAGLIMVCTLSALNGCIISYPRVYFRMAEQHVFFRNARKIHPLFLSPYIALIYSAVWSAVLVCSGTFDQITNLIIFASFGFFGLAAWGLISMKSKRRITARVIGYPVVPWLVIIFCLALMINTLVTSTKEALLGIALVMAGLPFYFYFKRKNPSV
jgi:basic amino acid/polyamine antiporter, APA family